MEADGLYSSAWELMLRAFFLAAPVAWVLSVVEDVTGRLFWPPIFRIGVVAASKSTPAPQPTGLRSPFADETEHAQYRVRPNGQCLYRRKYRFFEFRLNTLLEIRCTLSWKDGVLTATGRYPIGTMLFLAIWLTLWTIGGLQAIPSNLTAGMGFLALGWFAVGGMIALSAYVERKRFVTYTDEVERAVTDAFAQTRGVR